MSGAAGAFDRNRAIAKLHVARTQLALTEESYRAILMRVAGVLSARDATDAQLLALLAEMRRFGFRPKPDVEAQSPQVRKIWALWRALAPYVDDSADSALFAFVKRTTGRSRPEWLDPVRANQAIEGLKAWLLREEGKRRADR